MERFEKLALKDGRIVECTEPKEAQEVCRVAVESMPSAGSFIRIEVWLPRQWNGIFVGLGNGGMAGGIDRQSLAFYARNGYAVAHTDMGTSRGRESGIGNPDVWRDFGWRATHQMTEVGKAILRHYYGRKESYAYFVGRSTGGQQAFSEAQRFPTDYDGILAGVPANNRVFLHTYFLWNHNHLTAPDGKGLFSPDEIEQITDCATLFFQERGDGEKGDNFVTFPYQGKETVEEFLAFLKIKHPSFSKEQIFALRAVYSGPVNPKTGEQIYNGMPIGSEIYGCGIMDCQDSESPHFYPFIWAFGQTYDGYGFDFADDLERVSAMLSADLNANDADLTEFYRRGGKLLAFSGSADPCVPFPDAIKYYNRVCDKMGGYEAVKDFFVYYLLPGSDHGGGGRGTNTIWCGDKQRDLFYALRNWREYQETPTSITVAHRDAEGKLTCKRPLYPYAADKKEADAFPMSCDRRYLDA